MECVYKRKDGGCMKKSEDCRGCDFLRHERPPADGVPGLRHLFRCAHPSQVQIGSTFHTCLPKFYNENRPIIPPNGFCKKEAVE